MITGGGPGGPGSKGMGGGTCAMAADCAARSNKTVANVSKYFIENSSCCGVSLKGAPCING